MDSTPFVLQPRQLRSGERYRQLRHHFFSSEDMGWICRDIISRNDVRMATSSWNQTDFDTYFARYGLRHDVLHGWIDIYLRGDPLVTGRPSVPCPLDAIGVGVITQLVEEGQRQDESDEGYQLRLVDAVGREMRGTIDRSSFVRVDVVSNNNA